MHPQPPRTFWQPQACPWMRPAAAGEPDSLALLRLARESMARGHRRVAAQRLLKLRALDADEIPEDLRLYCEEVLRRLPPRERTRMQQAAREWVAHCATAFRPVAASC